MRFCTCLSPEPVKFSAYPFKGDFVENAEAIRKLGFDGIGLIVRDPLTLDQDAIIETVKSAGMEIPAIGTGLAWGEEGLSFTDPDPMIREKASERIFSHVPLAEKAGAVIVIGLVRGIVRPEVDSEAADEWMFDGFSRCCQRAADSGVRIAFEPINRYETNYINTIQDALQFISDVDLQNLGILADTFHMNIEEANLVESLQLAGDRVHHVQFTDSNRLAAGRGHIDFGVLAAALRNSGYRGYLSTETLPLPDSKTAARQAIELFRTL